MVGAQAPGKAFDTRESLALHYLVALVREGQKDYPKDAGLL